MFLQVFEHFYRGSCFTGVDSYPCKCNAVAGALQSKFTASEKPYGAGYVCQVRDAVEDSNAEILGFLIIKFNK